MAETENYGLYVTDEDTDRFIDWRKRLSGETDSNMVKIDQALHEKANKQRGGLRCIKRQCMGWEVQHLTLRYWP